MAEYGLPEAVKAQQWEIAKGHLRALVVMQGSYFSSGKTHEDQRWQELEEKVEAFIKDIQDNALQE